MFLFFFFQAEDGIRDYKVTGVQTCALPISRLAQCLGRACEALATAATARRDHPAAEEWCRRLTALDPLNSRYALGLVKALTAAGDRAGALRYEIGRAHV